MISRKIMKKILRGNFEKSFLEWGENFFHVYIINK